MLHGQCDQPGPVARCRSLARPAPSARRGFNPHTPMSSSPQAWACAARPGRAALQACVVEMCACACALSLHGAWGRMRGLRGCMGGRATQRLVELTWLRGGGGVAVDEIKQRVGREHAARATVHLPSSIAERVSDGGGVCRDVGIAMQRGLGPKGMVGWDCSEWCMFNWVSSCTCAQIRNSSLWCGSSVHPHACARS